MKQKRNAEATKARILEEATRLFAARGYDGTSLNDIVEAANSNKRMIYHYFGDKRGLYRQLFINQWQKLETRFTQETSALPPANNSPEDIFQRITLTLNTYTDFMAHSPEFTRLMMWEGLEGGEISRSIWHQIRGPLHLQMVQILEQAKNAGLLDARLDPSHMVVSMLGAISFYFAHEASIGDMIGEDPSTPEAIAKRKQQILLMMENIMK